MATWWANNWLNVAATLLAVVGLYLAFRSWKRKQLHYCIRSNNFFSGLEHTVPEVQVSFPGYGQGIKALTVTKIAFWNSGNDTIRKTDVVKEDPLVVRAKEGIVLLSISITDCVSALNKIDCGLNRERTQATIAFEYLDPKQGAIIQVFHTGYGNADITLSGTIMGPTAIRRRVVVDSAPRSQKVPSLSGVMVTIAVLWTIWLILLLLEVFGIRLPENPPPPPRETIDNTIFLTTLGSVLLALTFLTACAYYFTRIPKPLSRIRGD